MGIPSTILCLQNLRIGLWLALSISLAHFWVHSLYVRFKPISVAFRSKLNFVGKCQKKNFSFSKKSKNSLSVVRLWFRKIKITRRILWSTNWTTSKSLSFRYFWSSHYEPKSIIFSKIWRVGWNVTRSKNVLWVIAQRHIVIGSWWSRWTLWIKALMLIFAVKTKTMG